MVIRYFAYGSNMSVKRLQRRTPTAVPLGTARLHHHALKFHKAGHDASAKCDAFYTGDHDDVVIGVLYELAIAEKPFLDKVEGLGNGYDEKQVNCLLHNGDVVKASTYVATQIDDALKPFHWYKQHVLAGAKEHRLPCSYIQEIENVESVADEDIERHSNELVIYRK